MSYSEFTLGKVSEQFGLSFVEQKLYEDVAEIPISPPVRSLLKRDLSLARAIGTEKARSEFLIAPILADIRHQFDNQISLFSGIDLPAAPEVGLNGVCDFLISRSSQQFFLTRPIIAVVEAKNENLSTGYGQCVAEMLGARIFNERAKLDEPVMFGVVTTGTEWRFLRMEGNAVAMDRQEYEIERADKICGVLLAMLKDRSEPNPVVNGGGK